MLVHLILNTRNEVAEHAGSPVTRWVAEQATFRAESSVNGLVYLQEGYILGFPGQVKPAPRG